MGAHLDSAFFYVLGNEAVLTRLEKLGRHPRILPHLVQAGFPPLQMDKARQWFAESAESAVEVYASQNMAKGFFEDESLLKLLCRYFECTDWKLEHSPWFFSLDDYGKFFSALVEPVEFHAQRLEQGLGEDHWGRLFANVPFEVGLERAKSECWEEICRQDFYWKPLATYTHVRAGALFEYLRRSVNILSIAPGRFNYAWEGVFREKLAGAMRRFEERLAVAVHIWQEMRRTRTRERGRRRGPIDPVALIGSRELLGAFSLLGLDPETATLRQVRRAFRRLSKETHPDRGGSPETFRRLSRGKDLAEAWLTRSGHGAGEPA